ncbi:MAG TPA: ABC transporter permease [Flexilinea sp.]|nr:ABC transporter permease [Flexilinea sp.]
MKRMDSRILNFWKAIKLPLLAVLGGFVLGALLMILAGYNPITGYAALLDGAFGGKRSANLVGTLVRAAPIIGLALGAGLAFTGGFFNIGGEGQMVLGAISSTLVGIYSPFPARITFILSLFTAILVSGTYAWICARMDVRFKIPVFISSLLLNYPANYFATYLVNHHFRDRASGVVQTQKIPTSLQIPKIIPNSQFHAGIIIIPVLVVLLTWLLKKTEIGYKIRMSGFNRKFLAYGGVDTAKLETGLMFASGAIMGLIGFLEVFGTRYRYIPGMLTTPLYAWTAITTAILADNNPLGILIAGFLMSAIQNGGYGMERMSEVPREISRVIQSIIIMIICAVSGLKGSLLRSDKKDS